MLYHTGMRGLFPLVSEQVARMRPLEQLRWIAFAHVEADECGAVEQFLAAAPDAQVAHGVIHSPPTSWTTFRRKSADAEYRQAGSRQRR